MAVEKRLKAVLNSSMATLTFERSGTSCLVEIDGVHEFDGDEVSVRLSFNIPFGDIEDVARFLLDMTASMEKPK